MTASTHEGACKHTPTWTLPIGAHGQVRARVTGGVASDLRDEDEAGRRALRDERCASISLCHDATAAGLPR